jgi:hypothetical protein
MKDTFDFKYQYTVDKPGPLAGQPVRLVPVILRTGQPKDNPPKEKEKK